MDIIQPIVLGAVGFVVARICWDAWHDSRERQAIREVLGRLERGEDVPVTLVSHDDTPDGRRMRVERTTLDGLCERMRGESVDDCE
jgi:hypothetical protein